MRRIRKDVDDTTNRSAARLVRRGLAVALVATCTTLPAFGQGSAPKLAPQLFEEAPSQALNNNLDSYLNQHRMLLAQYAALADEIQVLAAQQKGLRLEREAVMTELEDARHRYREPAGNRETKRRQAEEINLLRADIARLTADHRYRTAELLASLEEQQKAAERLQEIAAQLAEAALAGSTGAANVAVGPLN